ncbi:MAG: thioredoxin TrxA [Gammaproteobacteria bacterium]|nr:thioredoxin TrxA [Gammaproteobacteria bacterium]
MSKNTVAVTDASFETEVLKAQGPVLVDFWAEWCGPCKSIAPILDEVSVEYSDRLKVVKLNTDENPDVAVKYSVRSIPTLMIFKNGVNEATRVGALTKSQLTAFVDEYL